MKKEIINIEYAQEHFEYLSSGDLLIKKSTKRGRTVGLIVVGWVKNSRKSHYRCMLLKGKKVRLHRVIFAIVHGYLPEQIDHIDGDSLNNKIENLRACTPSKNMQNSKIRSDNESGIKGLGFHKLTNRWRGRIKLNCVVHLIQRKEKQFVINWLSEMRPKLHKEFSRNL